MKILRSYFHRLRSLFRRGPLDRELNDELAARLEMHTADNLRTGMPPENARRDALLKLGGGEQTKESRRERRGLPAAGISSAGFVLRPANAVVHGELVSGHFLETLGVGAALGRTL